jgi:plasmid maintenance system killer protein
MPYSGRLVDENFRLTFRFEGKDAVQVDYRDYH